MTKNEGISRREVLKKGAAAGIALTALSAANVAAQRAENTDPIQPMPQLLGEGFVIIGGQSPKTGAVEVYFIPDHELEQYRLPEALAQEVFARAQGQGNNISMVSIQTAESLGLADVVERSDAILAAAIGQGNNIAVDPTTGSLESGTILAATAPSRPPGRRPLTTVNAAMLRKASRNGIFSADGLPDDG